MQLSYQKAWRNPWVLCGLSFVLGVFLTVIGSRSVRAVYDDAASLAIPTVIEKPPAAGAARLASVSSGRWGTLEFEKVPLEEPSQSFADSADRLKPPRWIFENYTPARLVDLLQSAQLTASQKAFFLDTNHWEPLTNGVAISPPDDLVLGLSPATRQQLYWVLAQFPINYPQFKPFNFPADGFDDRFADSGLPPEKIELIRRLTYPGYGYSWLCVDRPLVDCFTTNEFRKLIRVLYSYPTWIVRLRVKPDSDINALVAYWGRGREQKLRPLLQSLAKTSHGESMDIAEFLPPFAQSRLYTFPDPEGDPAVLQQDCFYTSMNFFNDPPDPRFTNIQNTREELQKDYVVASPPGHFGDVVLINDDAGNGIHACIYIADDFVFTKNGYSSARPWVLMKMSDVLACFPSEKPQHFVFWRRKGL